MMRSVIGIDVGGARKGFHAVAMQGQSFVTFASPELEKLSRWLQLMQPAAIAIDAPSSWAVEGGSRTCERMLRIGDERISCFSTPTEERAAGSSFYDWVRNGLTLYQALQATHSLYSGGEVKAPVVGETFPQAVACMLAGRKVSAKRKARVRREVLDESGYDVRGLHNIDLVDAALCALTAEALIQNRFVAFGRPEDGFIVTPAARGPQI